MKHNNHTAEWTLCVLTVGFAAFFALHLIVAGGASPQSPLLGARDADGGHILLREQWGDREWSAGRTGEAARLLIFDQFRARPNINSASASVLSTLPGIGPKTAAKIIAYRDAAGRMESPSALSSIPGIGSRTMKQLGEALTFGERMPPREVEVIDLR
ncbi:helix-hairpin-helix domain-containing protein [bacterium]|nr:helix-hairpin-helix domain-containing protein [bacterium]